MSSCFLGRKPAQCFHDYPLLTSKLNCTSTLCVRFEEATDKLKTALETEPHDHVMALATQAKSKLCHCYSKISDVRVAALHSVVCIHYVRPH